MTDVVNVHSHNVKDCVEAINEWVAQGRKAPIHVIIHERSEETEMFFKALHDNIKSWFHWMASSRLKKGVIERGHRSLTFTSKLLPLASTLARSFIVPDGDMFTFVSMIDEKLVSDVTEEEMIAAGVPRLHIDLLTKQREIRNKSRESEDVVRLPSAKIDSVKVANGKGFSSSRAVIIVKSVIDVLICAAASYGVYSMIRSAF